ncbi:MAG: hypothetical protein RLO06_06135 [Parvibaculum sp.]
MTNTNEPWRSELETCAAEWAAEGRPSSNDHPYAPRLLGLCRNFEFGIAQWPEVQEAWSPLALAERAFLKPSSPGEQLQAAFVLHVWNRDFPCPTVNVVEFAARLDPSSRAAIANWLSEPWFP